MIRRPKTLSHGEPIVMVGGGYDTAQNISTVIGLGAGAAIGAAYAFYRVAKPSRQMLAVYAGLGGAGGAIGAVLLFSLFTMGMSGN